MNRLLPTLLATTLTVGALSLPTNGLAHLPPNTQAVPSLAPMLQGATPAVVNIGVEKLISKQGDPLKPSTEQNLMPMKVIGVGSGVIINAEKGYIVTNAHVVKDESIMIVTLKDGYRYRAKLIGKDEGFDLAVIQINAHHLTQMSFGNSNQLKVGDFVVAIGSPFGLTQTVTSGVVSALNRQEPHIDNFQNFIQTDAPINPGNSGGALIDLHGKLVGINTAIVTPMQGNIGIGFAIPSNMVKNVCDQLIQYGKVQRGMLGVMAQNITPELASAMHLTHNHGAIVTKIVPNSPAEKAGLKIQDIIESVNDTPIQSSAELHNLLGLVRPGTTVTLHILRDGKSKTLTTKIESPQKIKHNQEIPFLSGLRLQKFSDLEPDSTLLSGVLVTAVSDNSDAALAGLIPGDVIVSANGKATPNLKNLIAIAEHPSNNLLLKVARDKGELFLVIQKTN